MKANEWIDAFLSTLTDIGLSRLVKSWRTLAQSVREATAAWVLLNFVGHAAVTALVFSLLLLSSTLFSYWLAPLEDIDTHLTLVYFFVGSSLILLGMVYIIFRRLSDGPAKAIDSQVESLTENVLSQVQSIKNKREKTEQRRSTETRLDRMETAIELIAEALREKQPNATGSEANASQESRATTPIN